MLHRDHRPHHVSGDILTKLSLDAMKEVTEMIPSADSHIDARRFAYQQIKDIVYADFKTNASSKKFDRCLLHPHQYLRCDLSKPHVEVTECTEDSDSESEPKLPLHVAGLICKGVSRMGLQEADGFCSWCRK